MAAGVGKTYSMLSDAQTMARRGVDVVIGYLEPHGRVETESLAVGIEQVPPKVVEHRGVQLKELDIDSCLARRPTLVLVDELAHTNPDGSRHAKRWQDIDELLQVGIDAFTTVNIQHVASLRDVVAQITGVFVQETVPDAFFESANEIELVDLPPEELRQRLEEGKVYQSEKINQALSGFFKRGNLLALRELSLRHVAERVDEQIRAQRDSVRSPEPWHASERILACIAPTDAALKVVRSARRLATGIHAELTVITVSSSRQTAMTIRGAAALKAAFELAESLGAKTVTLAADDIAAEVIRYARANNFTTILVGKPPRSRFRQAFMGSLVDEIIRLSGNIDVLVVNQTEQRAEVSAPLALAHRGYQGYIAAFGVTLVSTGVGLVIAPWLKETNVAMLYLLGPTWIGFRYGRRESLFGAILAVIAFDLSIVPPQGSFAVSDAQYLITFAVMLIVAVTTSTLAQRLRHQANDVSQRERSTAVLYEVSRHLANTRKQDEMAVFAAMKISEVTGSEVAIGVIRDGEAPTFLVASPSQFEKIPKEQGTWTWVLDNLKPAGRSTDSLAGSQGFYLPLLSESRCLGVVGIQLPHTDRLDFGTRHLVDAICAQLASSLERVRLARESIQATVRVEAEKSRNSLLSAVSHDLRTPLAAIQGSANLISNRPSVSDEVRNLSVGIEREAERMGKLVRNLLDMSRVEGPELVLSRDWYSLEELIATSVERTESLFSQEVKVELNGEIPLGRFDGILIEQVLVNLLENAARHGDCSQPVTISVHSASETFYIDVLNHGSTVPAGDLTRIFEKFHRTGTEGCGLGLAICRAIIRAHGGRIWAENRPPDGIVFRIELPVS